MRAKLEAWVRLMQARALRVVGMFAALGVLFGITVASGLTIDADTKNMLSADLPWRQAEAALRERFPQLSEDMVLVIDAPTPEGAQLAQRTVAERLHAQPEHFSEVFAPELEPYFQRSGLLYLEVPALEALAARLTLAQPFLGALAQDPSIHGLFGLLEQAATHGEAQGFDLAPALGLVAAGVEAAAQGREEPVSWQSLMGTEPSLVANPKRRYVALRPRLDFSQLLPAAAPMAAIREAARDLPPGIRVRVTGEAALAHEELEAASEGMVLVMLAALGMVAALLFLALRSTRLMAAAVVTLVYGLVATAAFAAVTVGHLNLISIAFGVLYVGLGLDYALYLCMQYRERITLGELPADAMARAAGDVGGFMLVCAATCSLGFFAFVPTSFEGIAELGLISGGGMFISLVLSLSLLPALVALWPPDPARVHLRPVAEGRLGRLLEIPYRHRRAIWAIALVAALAALFLAPRARFDYDPINLRDAQSESVATFRELQRDPSVPALTLSVLATDAASAQALARRLGAAPVAARAMSLADFVPADQDAKLAVIEDLAFTLALPAEVRAAPATAEQRADDRGAIAGLLAALPAFVERHRGDAQGTAAAALLAALRPLQNATDAQLGLLQSNLIGGLPAQITALARSLEAAAVTEADLPPALAARWRSADGQYRVEVWPREVLDNPQAMERFIDGVRALEPSAVGPPVGFLESGRTVVQAFREAFAYSLVAIFLLLVLLLRSLGLALLVMLPLLLAGLLSTAGMVLLGVPFNFANVIALPLILGVGVDYGVYLAQRGRAAPPGTNLLHTGTARAVLYGALITLANFGNLVLAPHPGLVSMGVLLTVGLGMTLLCTLVLLPSLLALKKGWEPPGSRNGA